jgi:hypothetical protein
MQISYMNLTFRYFFMTVFDSIVNSSGYFGEKNSHERSFPRIHVMYCLLRSDFKKKFHYYLGER